MDIRRLTHFIALAEEGRFALAAARVHLSQAAFSRSIQTLEESLGLRLFDRGAGGARVTPAGEIVLRRARELVFESRCLQRDIELVKQGDAGEVSIGVAPIPAAVLLPELLCQLRRQSPQLVTRVQMGKLPKLLEQLEAQELDFCLGDPRLMARNARYETLHVGKQYGGFYCRRSHPLARKAAPGPDALRQYGVAMISLSPPLLEGIAALHGFVSASEFPLVTECDDIGTLLHLVMHSDVIALLPGAVAARAPKPLHLLRYGKAPPVYADVHALWLKGRTLSPSARRAIAMARGVSDAAPQPSAPGR
jgi:DNA-binding transcriptional LysR family regulator